MSASQSLRIAVIGHTNVGKTSLLRTLTRDELFGEVSPRSATTRQVERATLMAGDGPAIEFYDTPGLEDSQNLLLRLEEIKTKHRCDWAGALEIFLTNAELQHGFSQEAKALRQLNNVDVALYVIDCRDPVRGKHRDELEILIRAARPILPVLNFVASLPNKADAWRQALARVNLHCIASFDSVVFDARGEIELYRKLALLAEGFSPQLERAITTIGERRTALIRSAGILLAELFIDIAAARIDYPVSDPEQQRSAETQLKKLIRDREQTAVTELFGLFQFNPDYYRALELPISEGRWQEDLFDPQSLSRFGISTSKAAATGASAGLVIDLMVGGITLGAAALTGATLGVLINSLGRHSKHIADKIRGVTGVQAGEDTLQLVVIRECLLLDTILSRGHGSVATFSTDEPDGRMETYRALTQELVKKLKPARREPGWSNINGNRQGGKSRASLVADIARAISERRIETLRLKPRD